MSCYIVDTRAWEADMWIPITAVLLVLVWPAVALVRTIRDVNDPPRTERDRTIERQGWGALMLLELKQDRQAEPAPPRVVHSPYYYPSRGHQE